MRIHPGHCAGECSRGAGPSVKRPRVQHYLLASLLFTTLCNAEDAPPSMAELIRRRDALVRRLTTSALPEFDVNLSDLSTCENMNITFNTLGGTPPYTISIAFENWYSTSFSVPATYADADVTTWLYQFPIPVFPQTEYGSETPHAVAIVGDSSGRLLNSSSMQQVKKDRTDCAQVQGTLDFTFTTEGGGAVSPCGNVPVVWFREPLNSTVDTWKPPLDLYLLPERQPPIHIPVTNASAGAMNYTLRLPAEVPFFFEMTDQGGSGGVSGRNVGGVNEYISDSCLDETNPFGNGMPAPTSTLAASVRMPDFSGIVSSIVTSEGIVTTATSVEIVRQGKKQGTDLDAGEIAGMAVGIAVAAGIIAALMSWCIWRRRHGRRLRWELPGDVRKEAPIDRNYIFSQARQASSTGSSSAPMLTLSPLSDAASEEREQRITDPSDSSFIDSQHGSFLQNAVTGSQTYASVPSGDHSTEGEIYTNALSAAAGRRMSTSSSAPTGGSSANPFVQPNSSAWAYRVRSNGSEERHPQSPSEFESLPMTESRRRSAATTATSTTSGRPRAESHHMTPSQSYSSSSLSKGPSLPASQQHFVQHQDAGLLMDDSLDDEELLSRVELPPSYHQIQRPGLRDATQRRMTATIPPSAGTRRIVEESDLGAANTSAEDESEFWL